ncbi:conserved hypothetical protein [Talaromyces stipitatus ATCC 10500]|uniref:Uncharacterized protein n=1 Tax=Talaromyces stipitatus (strain ATCC 10500 / CBS 375.48 / QM 6759 / NRRL 1006) TaxID=441959 RepID=B8MJI8_TALSN|nr:uncharacterized protein TSTA_046420 [Talaromyces stipitatus ATCC 10500]EED15188.1 conserved hypothetical protein [Talaromyces stipitatus ATCC 10500]
MFLKRKASCSSETLHGRSFTTDVPHHLNSRTRKRVRDNRPDQQTVYANTLRILYQAQKEPTLSYPSDEPSPSSQPPSEPEALDPRQQTLLKFFRPAPAPSSSMQADTGHQINNSKASKVDSRPVHSVPRNVDYDLTSWNSGSSTPSSTRNMDMDMDSESSSGYTPEKRWDGWI